VDLGKINWNKMAMDRGAGKRTAEQAQTPKDLQLQEKENN
jgi:hypothetical protein